MLLTLQSLLKSTSSSFTSRKARKRRHVNRGDMQAQILEDRMLLAGIFTSDDIVVEIGDAAPAVIAGNINGTFGDTFGTSSTFSRGPIIDENGQALFQAATSDSPNSDSGLFYSSSTGPITLVAREKQGIPSIAGATLDSGITNGSTSIPLPFNENGLAVFSDVIRDGNTRVGSGIFVGSNGSNPILKVREGDAAPGAGGSFIFNDLDNEYATINNSGEIAFTTELYDTVNHNFNTQAVFKVKSNGDIVQVVREGDLVPGTSSTFTSLSDPWISDNGEVLFWGTYHDGTTQDSLFVYQNDGTLRVVTRSGLALGLGNPNEFIDDSGGSSGLRGSSGINAKGDVAFQADVEHADVNIGWLGLGVFVRAGNGGLREVVRSGDDLPNGNKFWFDGPKSVTINNNGDIAFTGRDGEGNSSNNKDIIFRASSTASRGNGVQEIVREGQTVPAGDATFRVSSLTEFTLNDSGQLAFKVNLDIDGDAGTQTQDALFFYDDVNGLVEIARVGDEIDGLKISAIHFAGNSSNQFLETNGDGLNNKGQVTFSYELVDEGGFFVKSGVAVVGVVDRTVPTSTIAGFVNGNWWVSSPDGNGNYTTSRWASGQTAPVKVVKGDFNGDGLQDVAAWLPNGEWQVGLANANKTFTFQKWTTWRTTDIKEIHVGDFNNDGKDDLVGLFKSGATNTGVWWVARSTGTGFASAKWGTYGNYSGIENVFVGNFDGVGGADLAIQATSGTWWVAKSTGTSFVTTKWGRWNISNGVNHYQVGDFNGDGKDDVAGLFGTGSSRSWWIAISNGSRFANQRWARWTVSQSLEGVVSGDFNGDGATDIAGLFNQKDWWVGLANTNKFTNQRWATWDFAANGLSDIQVGSSNGDFRQDIFARRDDNGKWLALQSTGTAFATKTLAAWSSNANWQHVQVGNFHDPSPSPAPPAVAPGFFTEVSDRASKTELVNTSRWISLKESEAAVGEMSSEQKPVLVLSEKETLESEAYEAFGSSKLLDLLYAM